MKTELTSAERAEQAEQLAAGLNRSKHRSPDTVYRALNIPTAWIARDICVIYSGGNFWAGVDVQGSEFCFKLGPTAEYADNVIDGLHLP